MATVLAVRPSSSKDRHSKVKTAKGLRDRRVRLSAPTAIQFFDVQDRLGFDQPSKAVDWLIRKARAAIDELAPADRGAATTEGFGQREELMPQASGDRQELRNKPRERDAAAQRAASTPEAAPSAARQMREPPAAPLPQNAHHLLPDLFFLSQLPDSYLPSAALLRHSADSPLHQPPPSPPLCRPFHPYTDFPPPLAAAAGASAASSLPHLTCCPPNSAAPAHLLNLATHLLQLSAPSASSFLFPSLLPSPDLPCTFSSASAAASALLAIPNTSALPPSTIFTGGTLQSIYNPVSSLSQLHSSLGSSSAPDYQSDFNASSQTRRETGLPSSSMAFQ